MEFIKMQGKIKEFTKSKNRIKKNFKWKIYSPMSYTNLTYPIIRNIHVDGKINGSLSAVLLINIINSGNHAPSYITFSNRTFFLQDVIVLLSQESLP